MLRAGTYYIGDLSYILGDRWDEVFNADRTGIMNLSDGTLIALFDTKTNEREYQDQEGFKYPVDSGTIGCIRVDDIHPMYRLEAMKLGKIVQFYNPFRVAGNTKANDIHEWDGVVQFGHILIDTDIVEFDYTRMWYDISNELN